MVSEADRIKAVERVRRSMESSSGNSPYQFKRKRGIYRALDRKDADVVQRLEHELALLHLLYKLNKDMFTACAYLPLMKGLTEFV
jgi:hypothetical protein